MCLLPFFVLLEKCKRQHGRMRNVMNIGKYLNVTRVGWVGWRGGGDCIPEWAQYQILFAFNQQKKVNK
jgi:hypothetical protein